MRCIRTGWLLAPTLVVACASPDRNTLAELRNVEPDMTEVRVEKGLDQAMVGYRNFLEQAPESSLTPEAMRRLADLKLEKEFGIFGDGSGELVELPAPEAGAVQSEARPRKRVEGVADHSESERDFERRAASETDLPRSEEAADLELPGGEDLEWSGPLEAIALYDELLATYPNYRHNDQVIYQKARAYDELGRSDEAIGVIDRLISEYPNSGYIDEVQFRRAEYFFVRKNYFEAEHAYSAITKEGCEFRLLRAGVVQARLVALQAGASRRGPGRVCRAARLQGFHRLRLRPIRGRGRRAARRRYLSRHQSELLQSRRPPGRGEVLRRARASELRGSHLQSPRRVLPREAPLQRRRGFLRNIRGASSAASVLAPLQHAGDRDLRGGRLSHPGARVEEGLRGQLRPAVRVLAALRRRRFTRSHELPEERSRRPGDALPRALPGAGSSRKRSRRTSRRRSTGTARISRPFPQMWSRRASTISWPICFSSTRISARPRGSTSARPTRIPSTSNAAEAGYAAIYAHREHEKAASDTEKSSARREAVASTLRFVDAFPDHEHAAVVMGAAVDDLYDMKEFDHAIATGQRLIEIYPEADPSIRDAPRGRPSPTPSSTSSTSCTQSRPTSVCSR